jgi:predicted transcriptional regulator
MKKAIISTRIGQGERDKLDDLCEELDRSQAWIISALIREADVDRLREISEGGSL